MRRGILALLVYSAQPVVKALPVILVQRATLDVLARRDLRVQPPIRVRLALVGKREQQARRVPKEWQVRLPVQVRQAQLVLLDGQDVLVYQVHRDNQEMWGHRDIKVFLVSPPIRVRPVLLVNRVYQARQ